MSEIQIQSAIIDYLYLRKHFFFRINNIPVYDAKNKTYRKMPKGSLKGVPDLLVFWKGYPVFLEVKTRSGQLSKDQKIFREKCELQGIEYHTVRSIEDVKEIGL